MYEEISKFISLILRHKPEAIDIQLDAHGWANVDELIAGINTKRPEMNLDVSILADIVRTDSKQRYSFNENKSKIRANQGHSINVDLELSEAVPPEILYHGTATKSVPNINKAGILRMSRQFVHLSSDLDTAIKVGSRHGEPVVYEIRAKDMYRTGYKFFLSANNVWLTDKVPVRFINKLKL